MHGGADEGKFDHPRGGSCGHCGPPIGGKREEIYRGVLTFHI